MLKFCHCLPPGLPAHPTISTDDGVCCSAQNADMHRAVLAAHQLTPHLPLDSPGMPLALCRLVFCHPVIMEEPGGAVSLAHKREIERGKSPGEEGINFAPQDLCRSKTSPMAELLKLFLCQ